MSLAIMNFSSSDPHNPNRASESCPATGEEAAEFAASETPNPHAFFARYARVYDTARLGGASMSEAMELVEAELLREFEQRRQAYG
jgi:hypothetical protein